MIRSAYALFFGSLSLWVGGLAALAVSAPVLFRQAALTRAQAGQAFGAMLRAFGYVEMACAAILLVSAIVLHVGAPGENWVKAVRLALLAVMILLLVAYGFGIHPAIHEERARIANFDALPEHDPAKAKFDRLHRWSTRLVGANLLVGLALLLFSAATFKSPS
jgi:hypothetical protein